jgi:thiamine-phosphate pyrophosphorylase
MPHDNLSSTPSDAASVYRILDANRNRCLEGLRVVEEYVRFIWEDRHLVTLCKQLRHDLVDVLADVPAVEMHAARDTLRDVGTAVRTAMEYHRADLWAVVAANWGRVQQSLRAIEEYLKVLAPRQATRIESLRYRAYAVERAVTTLSTSVERLAGARLYVLIDGRSCLDAFRQLVEQLVAGGVDVLQLRDKSLPDRSLLERAHLLRAITREHQVLFIMNDRADLAAIAHADGVHVGQDELTVKEVRSIVGTQPLIGVSTHNIEQARQAVLDGANYLGCGPTFRSVTKDFSQFPGPAFLRQVAREIQLPAFAIGGIDESNLPQVCAAGLDRVAVSQAVLQDADPAQAARRLKSLLTAAGPPSSKQGSRTS